MYCPGRSVDDEKVYRLGQILKIVPASEPAQYASDERSMAQLGRYTLIGKPAARLKGEVGMLVVAEQAPAAICLEHLCTDQRGGASP